MKKAPQGRCHDATVPSGHSPPRAVIMTKFGIPGGSRQETADPQFSGKVSDIASMIIVNNHMIHNEINIHNIDIPMMNVFYDAKTMEKYWSNRQIF